MKPTDHLVGELSILAMMSLSGIVLNTRVLSCSLEIDGEKVRREYIAFKPEKEIALAPVIAPDRIKKIDKIQSGARVIDIRRIGLTLVGEEEK